MYSRVPPARDFTPIRQLRSAGRAIGSPHDETSQLLGPRSRLIQNQSQEYLRMFTARQVYNCTARHHEQALAIGQGFPAGDSQETQAGKPVPLKNDKPSHQQEPNCHYIRKLLIVAAPSLVRWIHLHAQRCSVRSEEIFVSQFYTTLVVYLIQLWL